MLKKEIIEAAVAAHNTVSEAAEHLGVNYNTLRGWCSKLGVSANKPQEVAKVEDNKVTLNPLALDVSKGDPQIVGVVPDLHAPAMLWDGVEWMVKLFRDNNVGKVVCIGDLIDNHATSRFEHGSDSLNPDSEWALTKESLIRLHGLIPEMTILSGNHCRRISSKASANGIPTDFVRSTAEVLDLVGWDFFTPVGVPYEYAGILYIHGDGLGSPQNPALQAERMGGKLVSGHTHKMRLAFSTSAVHKIWGCQVGCLIDTNHYGMRYGMNMVSKVDFGCCVVNHGNPFLFQYDV